MAVPDQIIPVTEGEVRLEWAPPGERFATRRSAMACVTWNYPSFKNGTTLLARRKIERDAFIRLDADTGVGSYRLRALRLHYIFAGQQCASVPALCVKRAQGQTVWALCDGDDQALATAHALAEHLRPLLLFHGLGYEVVTAAALATEPAYTNAVTLLQWGRQPVSVREREQIRHLFYDKKAIYWPQLIRSAAGTPTAAHVAHLILQGELTFDGHRSLNVDAPIFLPQPRCST